MRKLVDRLSSREEFAAAVLGIAGAMFAFATIYFLLLLGSVS